MRKTHIQRIERSTDYGNVPLSLCGMARDENLFVMALEATCQRCQKTYQDHGVAQPAVAEALVRGKEVRTTSSTGGQKGVKLERHDLIPAGPLRELAVLFGVGARKYDVHQWRRGYEFDKSYAALQRHALLWHAGFDYDVCSNDPEGCQHVDSQGEPFVADLPDACYNHTGAHHLTAVAWHAFVLLEFKDTHPDHDNRYIPNKE